MKWIFIVCIVGFIVLLIMIMGESVSRRYSYYEFKEHASYSEVDSHYLIVAPQATDINYVIDNGLRYCNYLLREEDFLNFSKKIGWTVKNVKTPIRMHVKVSKVNKDMKEVMIEEGYVHYHEFGKEGFLKVVYSIEDQRVYVDAFH